MSYEDRDKKIEERIKEKDLSINCSWAINNATNIASALIHPDNDIESIKNGIKYWTKWYLQLYQEIRHEEAEKLVDKENSEEKPL